jgi:hypothetical protein
MIIQPGIPVNRIANLETAQLSNDNTVNPFFFDRDFNTPFNIPKDYSFVITDIIVNAEVTNFTAAQFFLIVITIDGGRSITVRCNGATTHLPLQIGLVVPGPTVPSPGTKGLWARNTSFSNGPVSIQVMGYFVTGATALAAGQVFTAAALVQEA